MLDSGLLNLLFSNLIEKLNVVQLDFVEEEQLKGNVEDHQYNLEVVLKLQKESRVEMLDEDDALEGLLDCGEDLPRYLESVFPVKVIQLD